MGDGKGEVASAVEVAYCRRGGSCCNGGGQGGEVWGWYWSVLVYRAELVRFGSQSRAGPFWLTGSFWLTVQSWSVENQIRSINIELDGKE